MRKVWIVAAKEYREVVQKKSFLIGALLTPILIGAMMFFPVFLAKKSETSRQRYVIIDLENEGYGQRFQQALEPIVTADGEPQFELSEVESYQSPEDEAWLARRETLDSVVQVGELDGAIVIYPGTLTDDSLIVISRSFDFKALKRAESAMTDIVVADRLSHSAISMPVDSVVKLTARVDLEIETPAGKRRDFDSIWITTMVMWMIMYITILLYGQGVMRSVIEEKNSRIVEVMISSVSPFELMLGKLVGLGGATMTQLAIWGALGGAIRIGLGGDQLAQATSGAAGVVFNPVFIVFFSLFFILGFLLYSTIYAAIGSIVSTEKEAQNFLFPIILLLVIPMLVSAAILQSPNKPWVVGLSLFPFVTPILMMIRINIVDPTGFNLSEPIILQALIGVILVALTLVFMVWLSARIFRVGILMTGKRPTFPEIIRWVKQT